ncbi:MAG: hypothetical protein WC976_07245 [Caldisericia bacterium]
MNKKDAIEILSQVKTLQESLSKTGFHCDELDSIKEKIQKQLGKMTYEDTVKDNEKHL